MEAVTKSPLSYCTPGYDKSLEAVTPLPVSHSGASPSRSGCGGGVASGCPLECCPSPFSVG